MLPRQFRAMLCLLLAVWLALPGCGGSDKPSMAAVKGKVTYKGAPVEGASVTFTPTNGSPATGQTNAQGEFTLKTLGEEGATLGDHVVTIAKMDSKPVDPAAGDVGRAPPSNAPPPKSLLPEKYAHPMKSDLKATVKADEENVTDFQLTD